MAVVHFVEAVVKVFDRNSGDWRNLDGRRCHHRERSIHHREGSI
jgi:hypothetical protein